MSANSKLSKIIPKQDAGKIFSLNSTVQAIVPLTATLIYTKLFALSISTYPGLIYHFSCLLMIITIGLLTVEDLFCPVQSQEDYVEE